MITFIPPMMVCPLVGIVSFSMIHLTHLRRSLLAPRPAPGRPAGGASPKDRLTEEKKRGTLEANDYLKKRGAADTMNADPQTVIQQALGLAEKDRAILAGLLLESLEVEPDADHEARWQAEVSRRVAELDTGSIPAIPWEEVKARLRQQRHGPPED